MACDVGRSSVPSIQFVTERCRIGACCAHPVHTSPSLSTTLENWPVATAWFPVVATSAGTAHGPTLGIVRQCAQADAAGDNPISATALRSAAAQV
jgi:hypothetical protein